VAIAADAESVGKGFGNGRTASVLLAHQVTKGAGAPLHTMKSSADGQRAERTA